MPTPADLFARRIAERNQSLTENERGLAQLRLGRTLRTHAGRFTVDGRGHAPPPLLAHDLVDFRSADPERATDIDEIISIAETIEADGVPAPGDRSLRLLFPGASRCHYCATGHNDPRAIFYAFDGNVLRADRDCPTKPGPHEVDLAIPSGILAVGNDFRAFFPGTGVVGNTQFLLKDRAEADAQAARGVLILATHEDRGALRRLGDDSFTLGDNFSEVATAGNPVPQAESLDGYWRSFADGQRIPADTPRVARVPVVPGTYRFTVVELDRAFDHDARGPRTVLRIRRINRR